MTLNGIRSHDPEVETVEEALSLLGALLFPQNKILNLPSKKSLYKQK
jgi:hypothetical protein